VRKLFTDRFVASTRAPGTVFDVKTRGLALRVGTRTKTWCFVYRNGGAPQWFRLGAYPAVSLAEARAQAVGHRHGLEVNGKDPAAERRAPPPEPEAPPQTFTFKDFVPVFLAVQKGRKKTWEDDRDKIARHVAPAWDALPLKDIKRQHVHELLDSVAAKGLTIGVNRIQALVSRIFTVALDRSLIDAHPAARVIKRFAEKPAHKSLTDDELRALWRGLDRHPGAAADAIRLRLLLGQRGGETAGMLWKELDLTTATWSMPPERTKNKRPHVVPLPETALMLLTKRRKRVPRDEAAVFPGFSLNGDEHKAIGALHGDAYTWKDLRRTVATRLAGLRFDDSTIGRALNHAKTSVTAKHYNTHAYVDEIRSALTAWDADLRRIIANKPKKQVRILSMRAR